MESSPTNPTFYSEKRKTLRGYTANEELMLCNIMAWLLNTTAQFRKRATFMLLLRVIDGTEQIV